MEDIPVFDSEQLKKSKNYERMIRKNKKTCLFYPENRNLNNW